MIIPKRVDVVPEGYELCPVCRGYGQMIQATFDQLPLIEIGPQHVVFCQVCSRRGYRLPPTMTMRQLFDVREEDVVE